MPDAAIDSASETLTGTVNGLDHWLDHLTFWPTAIEAWVQQGFHAVPTLVLGLAVLVVLPPLVFVGVMLSRAANPATTPIASRRDHWHRPAWLRSSGQLREVISSERPLVRIGRGEDNDLRLNHDTVHRCHALVHRSEDGEHWIVDLSGPQGNGITVNGLRIDKARLADGDCIRLGEVEIRFDAVGRTSKSAGAKVHASHIAV